MKLFNIASIATLTLNLVTAIAIPVGNNKVDTASKIPGSDMYPKSFTACRDANWKNCKTFEFGGSAWNCYNFAPEWRDVISSIKTNKGYECRVYTGPLCTGQYYTFSDAQTDLSKPHKGHFNDNIFALRCWKVGDTPPIPELPNIIPK